VATIVAAGATETASTDAAPRVSSIEAAGVTSTVEAAAKVAEAAAIEVAARPADKAIEAVPVEVATDEGAAGADERAAAAVADAIGATDDGVAAVVLFAVKSSAEVAVTVLLASACTITSEAGAAAVNTVGQSAVLATDAVAAPPTATADVRALDATTATNSDAEDFKVAVVVFAAADVPPAVVCAVSVRAVDDEIAAVATATSGDSSAPELMTETFKGTVSRDGG
jgi:hypothetical protein